MVPELVDAHQLLGRSVSEPDLLELVQLVRFPVDGRTKVTFKDCPNPRIVYNQEFKAHVDIVSLFTARQNAGTRPDTSLNYFPAPPGRVLVRGCWKDCRWRGYIKGKGTQFAQLNLSLHYDVNFFWLAIVLLSP